MDAIDRSSVVVILMPANGPMQRLVVDFKINACFLQRLDNEHCTGDFPTRTGWPVQPVQWKGFYWVESRRECQLLLD